MTLLVVNFHYVSRERAERPRAIFPISVTDLVAQLELLLRTFEPVTRDAIEAAVAGNSSLPERALLVTFDDGLRVQAELALPALLPLGVVPVFFIAGKPLAEGRALFVHKVHHIREVLGPRALTELLEPALAQIGLSSANVRAEEAEAAYGYDEPDEARLKFLLNRVLPFELREAVVDDVFAQVVESEQRFCADLYLPVDRVAELEREHRAVGAHSYSHRPLALLEPGELRRDLELSARVLEELVGARPGAMSYPHGSVEAVDRAVADAAAASGFRLAFTMERAFNGSLDDPLLLARIDTNDAIGGARPLFAVGDGGELTTSGRMTAGRTRYGVEAT